MRKEWYVAKKITSYAEERVPGRTLNFAHRSGDGTILLVRPWLSQGMCA